MNPIQPATRTQTIKYAVRDILAVAEEAKQAGKQLLYLNIGDPIKFDFETPAPIIDAIHKALRDGHTGYGPSAGTPESLDAIRAEAEAKGLRAVRDIFVGNGCSEVIDTALCALANRGDNILTPSPGYPLYTALVSKLELEPNAYYLDEENGWQPDLDDMAAKINDRTRAIVLINPNNPTGSLYSREILEGIIELALQHDLVIISDEIYDKLVMDGKQHISTAALTDEAPILTFNGLSKAFVGPGLRVGWGILSGPASVVGDYQEAIHKFLRARLCGVHPMQHAIAPALANLDHLPGVMQKLTRRRDITVEMLNSVEGISCVAPDAAFYAFPKLEIDGPDEPYVAQMIRETGVVVVHGSGFGQKPGSAHFRAVFLPPEDQLRAAYQAIGDYVSRSAASV